MCFKVKRTLSVAKKESDFYIIDISISLLKIFDIDESCHPDLKNTKLELPFLISYLHLLDSSTINYLELFYDIKGEMFTIQIVKKDDTNYLIFFDSAIFNKKDDCFAESCFTNYSEFTTNDKDLLDVIKLKNKTPETINLEMIYLLKKIQEEVKELKENDSAQENKFIEKEIFSLPFLIAKLGFRNLILFLFAISLIESFIIEPFLQPVVNQVKDHLENSLIE